MQPGVVEGFTDPGGEVELDGLQGPFRPKIFYDFCDKILDFLLNYFTINPTRRQTVFCSFYKTITMPPWLLFMTVVPILILQLLTPILSSVVFNTFPLLVWLHFSCSRDYLIEQILLRANYKAYFLQTLSDCKFLAALVPQKWQFQFM